jgi:hypothetical protein
LLVIRSFLALLDRSEAGTPRAQSGG